MAFEGMNFGLLTQGVPQIDVAGSMGKGLQLRDMMQARKDDDTMRALSAEAGGDLGQLADLAQQKGLYRQAQGIRKQKIDFDADVAKTKEALARTDKLTREAVQAGNDEAAAFATWAFHENAAGRLTPEAWTSGLQEVAKAHPVMAGALQQFPQFSESAIRKMLYKASTTKTALSTFMPKVEERSGALVPVTTDILGQQTVGAPVGFKAQDTLAKINQDEQNGLISAADAAAARKKATTHGALVNIGYSQPFEVTDPTTGQSKLVQQDKQGNLREVPGYAPKGGAKPLTEAQGNALGFGIRAREADVILNRLEAKGADVAGGPQRVASSVPFIGNYLTPAALQEYDQAKRNFVSAVLRKESGAAISASEFANEEKKYFPQPGDSPEVIRQKADARKTAIGVLQIQAGRDLPEIVKPVKPAKPGKPASASGKATFAEIREAVKPGGKYAGKTVDEVVFALRQRGIEVQ